MQKKNPKRENQCVASYDDDDDEEEEIEISEGVTEDSSSYDSDSDSDSSASSTDPHPHPQQQESADINDEEEDDEVVKAMLLNQKEKLRNSPPDLKLNSTPSCICFHSIQNILAVGTFNGNLLLCSYSDLENKVISSQQSNIDEESVRELIYSVDGDKLIVASSNQQLTFFDVKQGLQIERNINNATTAPVSSMYTIDENIFATGDDDGNVCMFDRRASPTNHYVSTYKLGEDPITSMLSNSEKKLLVCSSGEGSIYSIKLHGNRVETSSEIYDYDFTSLCLFKEESKLGVGNSKGDVYVFNWNEFGKHCDIYTGIGEGINSIIGITERILITATDDGFIKAVHFYPQKYLGVVGKVNYPIDKIDVCNDGHLIASIGSGGDEDVVKFWNVGYFADSHVGSSNNSGGGGGKMEKGVKGGSKPGSVKNDLSKRNLPSSKCENNDTFFKGLL